MVAKDGKILVSDYNSLQTTIANILGATDTSQQTGYGATVTSNQVSADTSEIAETDWDKLRADILKCRLHQTDSTPTLTNVPKTTSPTGEIQTTVTNEYINIVSQVFTDRDVCGQLAAPVNRATKSKTATQGTSYEGWSDRMTQDITIEFATAAQARYFFNAGGTFDFSSSRVGPDPSLPQAGQKQNTLWTNFLAAIGTVKFNKSMFYSLTSSYQAVITKTVAQYPSLDQDFNLNSYKISAKCDVANNASGATKGTAKIISLKIEWIDSDNPYFPYDAITGTMQSVFTETKPNGTNISVSSPSTFSVGELIPEGDPSFIEATWNITADKGSIGTPISETASVSARTITFTFTTTNYPGNRTFDLVITGETLRLTSPADFIQTGWTTGTSTEPDYLGFNTLTKSITTGSQSGPDNTTTATASITVNTDAFTESPPETESFYAYIRVPPDPIYGGNVLKQFQFYVSDTSKTPTPQISVTRTGTQTGTVAVQGEGTDSDDTKYVSIQISNIGDADLIIGEISSTLDPLISGFVSTHTGLPRTIAAGASYSFTVCFTGVIVTAGVQNTLVVKSNANDPGLGPKTTNTSTTTVLQILSVILTATYTFTLSPSTYTGSTATDGEDAGTSSQSFTITHTGNAKFNLDTVSAVINGGVGTISVSSSPQGQQLLDGGTKTFSVGISTLTFSQTISTTVTVSNNKGQSQSATGSIAVARAVPSISVSVSPQEVSAQVNKLSQTQTVTVTNSGTAKLRISSFDLQFSSNTTNNEGSVTSSAQLPDYSYTWSNWPVSSSSQEAIIPAGSSRSFIVTFTPKRIGRLPGNWRFNHNVPTGDNPALASMFLNGTALVPTFSAALAPKFVSGQYNITDNNGNAWQPHLRPDSTTSFLLDDDNCILGAKSTTVLDSGGYNPIFTTTTPETYRGTIFMEVSNVESGATAYVAHVLSIPYRAYGSSGAVDGPTIMSQIHENANYSRTIPSSGVMTVWPANSSTASFKTQVQYAVLSIPIGKNYAGTQRWYTNSTTGNNSLGPNQVRVTFEIAPNMNYLWYFTFSATNEAERDSTRIYPSRYSAAWNSNHQHQTAWEQPGALNGTGTANDRWQVFVYDGPSEEGVYYEGSTYVYADNANFAVSSLGSKPLESDISLTKFLDTNVYGYAKSSTFTTEQSALAIRRGYSRWARKPGGSANVYKTHTPWLLVRWRGRRWIQVDPTTVNQVRPPGSPQVSGMDFFNSTTYVLESSPFAYPTPNCAMAVGDYSLVPGVSAPPLPWDAVGPPQPNSRDTIVVGFGIEPATGTSGSASTTRIVRSANLINLTNKAILLFYVNKGTDSTWGQTPEGGSEGLYFEYSTDGSSWTQMGSIVPSNASGNTWTKVTVNIPVAARTNVYIRVRQNANSGAGSTKNGFRVRDTWLLSNSIYIIPGSAGRNAYFLDTEFGWENRGTSAQPFATTDAPFLYYRTLWFSGSPPATVWVASLQDDGFAIYFNSSTAQYVEISLNEQLGRVVATSSLQTGLNLVAVAHFNGSGPTDYASNPGFFWFEVRRDSSGGATILESAMNDYGNTVGYAIHTDSRTITTKFAYSNRSDITGQ